MIYVSHLGGCCEFQWPLGGSKAGVREPAPPMRRGAPTPVAESLRWVLGLLAASLGLSHGLGARRSNTTRVFSFSDPIHESFSRTDTNLGHKASVCLSMIIIIVVIIKMIIITCLAGDGKRVEKCNLEVDVFRRRCTFSTSFFSL